MIPPSAVAGSDIFFSREEELGMSRDHLELSNLVRDVDLTPQAGAATDVAPLGRGAVKPAHELTADEDEDVVNWEAVAVTDRVS
jgi:hypothetical protein